MPKWFWISIGAIVLITIGATWYCNYKSKENATATGNDLTDQKIKDALQSNSTNTTSVFDLIPSLNSAVKQ